MVLLRKLYSKEVCSFGRKKKLPPPRPVLDLWSLELLGSGSIRKEHTCSEFWVQIPGRASMLTPDLSEHGFPHPANRGGQDRLNQDPTVNTRSRALKWQFPQLPSRGGRRTDISFT